MSLDTALRNLSWLWCAAVTICLVLAFGRRDDFGGAQEAAAWLNPLVIPTTATALSRWVGVIKKRTTKVVVERDLYRAAIATSVVYLLFVGWSLYRLNVTDLVDAGFFISLGGGLLAIILAGLLVSTEAEATVVQVTPSDTGSGGG